MIAQFAKRDIKLPATLIAVASMVFLLAWPMMPRTVLVTNNGEVTDLSAYVLPDGSLPFLCDATGGDAPAGGYRSHCPLCTLAKILGPTPREPAILRVARFTRAAPPLSSEPSIAIRVVTGLGARAPPSIV
ncbi:MAG: hypothetical protein MnENMB40S_20470 [Rhizobiaceae bacterium MnEN-MB40S]|nr:MAG: hypothetical protein MnENMB40S_20470 [Rhizobiaceae bacterium MnEN-MB40S]